MLLRKNPGPRLGTYFKIVGLILAFEILMRLAFFAFFGQKEGGLNWHEIRQAVALGLRFDLRVAILLGLPWIILSFVPYLNPHKKPYALKFWSMIYALILLFIAIFYAGDFGYYAYLSSRINITIFEFAQALDISLKMVHETYNLFLWLPLLALFFYATLKFLNAKIFAKEYVWAPRWTSWRIATPVGIFVFFLVALGIHNSFGQYPLRWSQAFFSQNVFVSALALNPLHYMYDTSKNPKRDFDENAVREHYEIVADYLGVKEKNIQTLNFKRKVPASVINEYFQSKPQRPNIVYIVMESMTAYMTGAHGNAAGASPFLDELAQNGLHFHHFYTPTEGTARSMFCLLTGIPDINAKSTSSRNPLIVNQRTLVNSFKDYHKYYFIGGSASWGNIRGVYQNNIENLTIYEEGSFTRPSTDVWGLSDFDLFRETAEILNKNKSKDPQKPFFAIVQAASFHRPYTIPAERGEFMMKELSAEELRRYGFGSNEEYNSFRFSDYSLGEFFRLSRNEAWFQNTIFIIHGDHGLPHNNAAHLSEGYKLYNLNRFHVPLVFYSPLFNDAKVITDMMSQSDVLPTLVGLLGIDAVNSTLGRNILTAESRARPRYAFSYVYYAQPLQLLLYDDTFLAFGTEKEISSLYGYSSDFPHVDIKDSQRDKFKEMSDLLMGIFQTSKYMLYHNQR